MKNTYQTWRIWLATLSLWLLSVPPPTVACTGDCNNDGEVTIDEIITMVNIALGTSSVATCARGDTNGDGEITIDEVIQAVGFALAGCPTTGGCETIQTVLQLDFDANSIPDLAGVSLRVAFRSSVTTLSPESVFDSIEDVSGRDGFFDAQIVPTDDGSFDQSLNLSYVASSALAPGPLVVVTFTCSGETIPTSEDFACTVTGASDSGGFPAPAEVGCRVEVLPPGQGSAASGNRSS